MQASQRQANVNIFRIQLSYLSISIPQRNIEYGRVPESASRRFVLCIIINRSLRKSKHTETLKTDSCFESFIALRKNY